MEKLCSKCGLIKDTKEFNNNSSKKDGLQHICKLCQKKYHRTHYLSNKSTYMEKQKKRQARIVKEYEDYKKTLSCSVCGESRWYVLDFHHIDRSNKECTVSSMVRSGFTVEKMMPELKKCEVLCSNCHRALHFLENRNKSSL